MNFRIKKSYIYLVACTLYIIMAIVFDSEFGRLSYFRYVFTFGRCISYTLILGKIGIDIWQRDYTKKRCIVALSVSVLLIISAKVTSNKNLLFFWLFIIAGMNVEYYHILKWVAIAHITGLLIVWYGCTFGFVENVFYVRTDGVVRESLGFSYTTASSNYFLFFALMWIGFRKNKMTVCEWILMLLEAIRLYIKTDTKSAFAFTILALVGCALVTLVGLIQKWHRFYNFLGLFILPICVAFIIYISFNYDPDVKWMNNFNQFITNRVKLGHAGFVEYGIKPFGQYIRWVGADAPEDLIYNYVDSSYVQILLNFGPVILGLIMLGMTAYVWRICKNQDVYLLLVYFIIVSHSTFDPQLVMIAYNSFWLAFHYVEGGEIPKRLPVREPPNVEGIGRYNVETIPVASGSFIWVNYLMNVILMLSTVLFPLITFPYASRILGPEGIGRVSFALSFVAYFNMIAQLGIPNYGIKACAAVRDDQTKLSRTVQEIFTINLITMGCSLFALSVVIAVVPSLSQDKLLYFVISSSLIFETIGMEWLYKALEKYRYITVRSLICKLIALAALFLLVHAENNYPLYGAISIFAASASGILNFLNAQRFIKWQPVRDLDLQRHFIPVLVFFAMACAVSVYTNLDTVMLGAMTDKATVGYYSAAVKIKIVLVNVVTALGAVLMPRSTYYVENRQMEAFRMMTARAMHFVILIAVPCMVYFMIYAKFTIYFLSGVAFEPAEMPMRLIMPTLLLIGISNILGMQVLIPQGKEKCVTYAVALGALVDFVINLALIPHMAAGGAALGTTIAEFAVLVAEAAVLRKPFIDSFQEVRFWQIIMSVVCGYAASVYGAAWYVRRLARQVGGWFELLRIGGVRPIAMLMITAVLFFVAYGGMLLLLGDSFVRDIMQKVLKFIDTNVDY